MKIITKRWWKKYKKPKQMGGHIVVVDWQFQRSKLVYCIYVSDAVSINTPGRFFSLTYISLLQSLHRKAQAIIQLNEFWQRRIRWGDFCITTVSFVTTKFCRHGKQTCDWQGIGMVGGWEVEVFTKRQQEGSLWGYDCLEYWLQQWIHKPDHGIQVYGIWLTHTHTIGSETEELCQYT